MSNAGFSVVLVDEVIEYLESLNARTFEKSAHSIDLMSSTPYIGKVYDPEYEAAPAPIPCRTFIVPETTVQLFYVVDEEKQAVVILWACDCRMDPRRRFARS